MNKYTKKVRIAFILGIMVALIFSSMTVSFAASGTKTMTVYSEVIKNGNYAYCAAHNGIYKVNLKTCAKKRIIKVNGESFQPGPSSMRIYKGYLYYVEPGPITELLCRAKLNGTGKKHLAYIFNYAISKGKIYYTSYSFKHEKNIKRVMKLNGKSKKKSSYKVKNRYKRTNASGYRVKQILEKTETEYFDNEYYNVIEYYTDYFIAPNGETIKLCSYTDDHLEEW